MEFRILIVDDSVVFRSQIKVALEGIPDIRVVGAAPNGKIALEKIEQGTVDIVILDLEMPEMSGLEMLQILRARGLPQTVIVFAAPSGTGVELAMSALRAGASDFISKPKGVGSIDEALSAIRKELVPKILQFRERILRQASGAALASSRGSALVDMQRLASQPIIAAKSAHFHPQALAIGSSTGGPQALENIFTKLKGKSLRIPIFVTQHMPPVFTDNLARRLAELSGHDVHEARQGEVVKAGQVYVAPGDYHMRVETSRETHLPLIRLDQGPKRNSVRPAVDNLFESLAQVYNSKLAAFVLTGMGEDGALGAKAVKLQSGYVVIQDQASSVVWGMPGAVYEAKAFDAIGSLNDCGETLVRFATE